jgi:hypothetical protein
MLAKHIKNVGIPPRKVSSVLHPVKDIVEARTVGVYSIPCECGEVYIGETNRSIETRINEYHRHVRLGHPDKSGMAEYRFNTRLIIWGP